MPISKLTGPMLSNVLVRDGESLAFSNTANSIPLLFIDTDNARIGVNTDAPTTDFTINGPGFANSFNLTNNLSLGGDVVAVGDVLSNNISASGNITTVNLTAAGFANAVNISASGNINAFANIFGDNINSNNVSASGNINSVNVSASGNINAFANIVAGNINANGVTSTVDLSVSGNANINSLNVTNMSVSGSISGNISTSTTGNVNAGNLVITNTATLGNIVVVDTTISSVGNVVIFAGTSGIAVPVGTLAQRPANVPSGTLRFNSENDSLETYDGTDWISTAAQPSTIYDQQITGTGVTTYALDYYTPDNNNLIVSINGITQRPGFAYDVVGTDIVFSNPLETTDIADIRYITNPTDVPAYGNSNVAAYLTTYSGNVAAGSVLTNNYLYANGTPVNFSSGSYANSNVAAYAEAGWAGNIIPSANVEYSLGNSTRQWKDLWVSNNTIYINSVPISVIPGNTLQVGGANVITANSSTTGNITAEYFIGNGSQLTGVTATPNTGDIVFTDSLITSTSGIIELLANSRIVLTSANTFISVLPEDIELSANVGNVRVEADQDVTVLANGLFSLTNFSNTESIYITTAASGNAYQWDFDNTGNLTLPGNTFAIKYANGTPVSIGSGSTADMLFANTTMTAASGDTITVAALDGAGVRKSSLRLDADGHRTVLRQWSSQDSQSYTTADWSTGVYTVEGGTGAVQFADAANIVNFISSLNGTGQEYYSINGGPQVAGTGWSGGGTNITLYTDVLPDTDPTTVTSFEYFYSYESYIDIDPDDELFSIQSANQDLLLQTLNQSDIDIESSRDAVFRGNGSVTIENLSTTDSVQIQTNTSGTTNSWQFTADGNLLLPTGSKIVGQAANSGYLNWLGTSSGDGLGYTTLQLIPDSTLVNADQYLILDPTSPGHIHIRAGGAQDNSQADLILGGENSFVKVQGGANPPVYIRADNVDWQFGTTGILSLPGEGVLQSTDDTVTLSSFNTTTGYANSVYLGSSGGLGFSDGEIGGNWLEIFRNGTEPEIRTQVGNITIQTVSNSTPYNWTFDNTGNLTLPADGYLRVTSGIVSTGGSPAPTLSGFSSVSAINLTATGNITGNTITSNKSLTLAVYADDTARDAAITAPAAGMLIFNTAAANFQGYNGTSWGNLTLS